MGLATVDVRDVTDEWKMGGWGDGETLVFGLWSLDIEAGGYKDVNLLGVSSILAGLNIAGNIEIILGFGGNGATMLIPLSFLPSAQSALLATQ